MNITHEEVQQVLDAMLHWTRPSDYFDAAISLLQSKLAEKDAAPINWLEAVTVNLVREGVNKHKARDLAQHFHSLIQKDDGEPIPQKLRPDFISGYEAGMSDARRMRKAKEAEARPECYQYLYGDTWRTEAAYWNGSRPTAARPLYTRPAP